MSRELAFCSIESIPRTIFPPILLSFATVPALALYLLFVSKVGIIRLVGVWWKESITNFLASFASLLPSFVVSYRRGFVLCLYRGSESGSEAFCLPSTCNHYIEKETNCKFIFKIAFLLPLYSGLFKVRSEPKWGKFPDFTRWLYLKQNRMQKIFENCILSLALEGITSVYACAVLYARGFSLASKCIFYTWRERFFLVRGFVRVGVGAGACVRVQVGAYPGARERDAGVIRGKLASIST